jgi:hypothetical protein
MPVMERCLVHVLSRLFRIIECWSRSAPVEWCRVFGPTTSGLDHDVALKILPRGPLADDTSRTVRKEAVALPNCENIIAQMNFVATFNNLSKLPTRLATSLRV